MPSAVRVSTPSPWDALWPRVPAPDAGRPGDPGLYGPGSVAWRIGRERALLAGGGATLLLQIAHPLVAAAVAAHSDFRRDPFARLRATLEAMLRVTFGDTHQAKQAAASVQAVHARVRGTLSTAAGPFPAGQAYLATDPQLALWVHATLIHSAIDAYSRFVRPLTPAESDAFVDEVTVQATLFGVPPTLVPASHAEFRTYVRTMLDGETLVASEAARALVSPILGPPVPSIAAPAMGVFRLFTAGMLPTRLRREFGLGWGARDRLAFAAASSSLRATLRVLPPAIRYWPHYRVACRRVGAIRSA